MKKLESVLKVQSAYLILKVLYIQNTINKPCMCYYMSKNKLPILYSKLLRKMAHYFLDAQ